MAERTIEIRLVDDMHFAAARHDGVTVQLDNGPLGMSPMELMLVSLGGCTGMDVISILRKQRQVVSSYVVHVSGVQATEHPHVYTSIHVRHVLEGTNLSETAIQRAIDLSEEKYCSAYAMLVKAAEITSSFEIGPPLPAD
jgi:putative redox protein